MIGDKDVIRSEELFLRRSGRSKGEAEELLSFLRLFSVHQSFLRISH